MALSYFNASETFGSAFYSNNSLNNVLYTVDSILPLRQTLLQSGLTYHFHHWALEQCLNCRNE